ncbi:MAG: PEGA domain-containing protein [Myxococcales bacterium]|nr:PEGA domain-containing protein [Myxococcales bacterium]
MTLVVGAAPARAQDGEPPTREAAKHFQRGVSLYGEADYRAALVEFKRAYALAPNAAVLYNIGETEYQLQEYAAALLTFRRYLSEASPGEAHRAEVESNVEVLRARVGHLSITTIPAGAEVTIDDQPVGKTPLDEPVLVSIGRRKVVAAVAGRPPVSRFVDVAADDNVSVTLQLPGSAPALASAAHGMAPVASADAGLSHGDAGATWRVVGWVSTGVLAAGAVTFAVAANKSASDLKNAKNSFPTSGATLNHDANLTSTFSILADSLTAATVVVGGITLISTLTAKSPTGSVAPGGRGAAGTGVRVVFGPAGVEATGTF